MDDPIAQPGELSADHRQYWDGQRWLDTLSPDGRWRWDGALWQLAETGEGHRAGGGDELGAVVVSFELGYSEARDALRWVLWHNWKLLAAPICSALLVGVGVSLLGTQTGLGLFAMLVGVYLIGMAAFILVALPAKAARKLTGVANPQRISFSDVGVHAVSVKVDSRQQWSLYSQVLEHGDVYLLRLAARGTYVPIPKRAFADATAEATFRLLVGRHLKSRLK